MSLKIGINLIKNYSINFDLPKRSKKLIKFIILHYTGMKKEHEAIKKLCSSKSKVSCHYFIKNNGKVLIMVPDLYKAWHAGVSSWRKYKSINKYSIGIEINNPGHYHGYRKFSSKQILSIIKLLKFLVKKYNIKKQNILGHSDVAPNRKIDPGEKFPWDKLAKKNLCNWHNIDKKKLKKLRGVDLTTNEKIKFFRNLHKIGYQNVIRDKNRINLIKSFQRKYRQNLINGIIDKECLLMSKNLIKKQ
tara:strand:+ start:20 stop:757 length:738 start_codon:yes stop_codon:yes gene_type:complete